MKFFAKLSHISGLENTSRARAHIRYIMRNGEGNFVTGTMVKATPKETGAAWGAIIDTELLRRKDARYQSRLIVALPNEFSEGQTRGYIAGLEREFFGNMKYTVAHHDNPGNKHLHFVYNDTLISSKRKNLEVRKKTFLSDLKNFSEKHFREQGIEVETVLPGEGRARLSRAEFEAQRQVDMAAALEEAKMVNEEIYVAATEFLGRTKNGQSRGDIKSNGTTVAERPAASGDGQAAIRRDSGVAGGLAPMPGSDGRGDSRADAAGAGAITVNDKSRVGGKTATETGHMGLVYPGQRGDNFNWNSYFYRAINSAAAISQRATTNTTGAAGVSSVSNNMAKSNATGKGMDAKLIETVTGKTEKKIMENDSGGGTWTRWLKQLRAKKEKTEKENERLRTDKKETPIKQKKKVEDDNPFAGFAVDPAEEAARKKRLDEFFAPVEKNNLSTKKENDSGKKDKIFMVDFDFQEGKYIAFDLSDPKNAGRTWSKNATQVKALDSMAALNAAGVVCTKIKQTGKNYDKAINGSEPENSGPGR